VKKLFKAISLAVRKLIIGTIILAIIIAIAFAVFLFIQMNTPYSEVIKKNWSIKLPDSYKEIYSTDSGPSFQGDGERYHILQYTKANAINNSVKWESDKDVFTETEIDKVLSDLNVSEKNMPSFQHKYKYYVTSKDDNSTIYLVFIPHTKKLYVIEDIY
jgi:hypothetical protein